MQFVNHKLYLKQFVLKGTSKEVKCQVFSKILKKYRPKCYLNFGMLSFMFTSRNMEKNYMQLITKFLEQNFFLKLALSSTFNKFLTNVPTIV